ncbi:hypothetical protein NW856_04815 [Synechococcus sp. R3-13]
MVIAVLLFGLASGIPTLQAATLGGSPYNRAQQEVVIAASPDQVLKAVVAGAELGPTGQGGRRMWIHVFCRLL